MRIRLPSLGFTLALTAFSAISVAAIMLMPDSANITVHGQETTCINAPDVTDGSQVIVTDGNGHILSTGVLAADGSKKALDDIESYDKTVMALESLASGGGGMSIYDFSVTVPSGQDRYGISIGGPTRGTIWLSSDQMQAGPDLSLGCL